MPRNRKTTLIVAISLMALTMVLPVGALDQWDLSADWPATEGSGLLPMPPENGAWSYGYGANWSPGTLSYTFTPWGFTGTSNWGILSNGVYRSTSNESAPFVGCNRGNKWPGADIPLDEVGGHSQAGVPIVFRWTAPRNTIVSVRGAGWVAYEQGQEPGDAPAGIRNFTFWIRKNNETPIGSATAAWSAGLKLSENRYTIPPTIVHVNAGDKIDYFMNPVGGGINGYAFTIVEVPPQPETPVFSPPPGTRHYSTYVSILSPTPGGVVHFTTDGSAPTASSPVFDKPILVTNAATIKAIAIVAGLGTSSVATGSYTVNPAGAGWNALSDWQSASVPAQGLGPDETWSYGFDTEEGSPVSFQAFRNFDETGTIAWTGGGSYYDSAIGNGPGMTYWPDPSGHPGFQLPGPTINMHVGSTPFGSFAVRWVAPASMTVSMSGSSQNTNTDVTDRPNDVGLLRNNEILPIWSAVCQDTNPKQPVSFSNLTFDVNRGDAIHFFFKKKATQGYVGCTGWSITPVSAERAGTPVLTPPPDTYSESKTIVITCADPDAVIRYTTDGSEPSVSNGAVYTGPIPLTARTTLKAKAWVSGLAESKTGGGEYIFKAPAVTIGPTPYVRNFSTYVTMTTADPNAVIHYTTNGSTPTPASPVYTAPIFITSATTFKAMSVLTGYEDSDVVTAAFTFAASSVTWSLTGDWKGQSVTPAQGSFVPASDPVIPPAFIGPSGVWAYGYDSSSGAGPYNFKLWDTYGPGVFTGQQGYHDETGLNPGFGVSQMPWDEYTGPYFLYDGGNIYAHTPGDERPVLFRWTAPATLTVRMSGKVHDGAFDDRPHEFGVQKNSEAPVWSFTSADPSKIGTFSNVQIDVNRGDSLYLFVRPTAVEGFGTIENWTIQPVGSERTAAPVFDPPAGSYAFSQYVKISSPDPGATIYYTTNGSEPTTSSPVYTGPILVTSAMTIKAKAVKSPLAISSTSSASYTFTGAGSWSLIGNWGSGVMPPVGIGPDGVWSYGHDTLVGEGPFAFKAWPEFGQTWATNPGYKDEAYYGRGTLPGGEKTGVAGASPFAHPANAILMHSFHADRPLLFRWTAPAAVTISMSGAGQVAYDNYLNEPGLYTYRPEQFGIRVNDGVDLWTAISRDPAQVVQFSGLTMDVNRGDAVYLWVRPTGYSAGFLSVNSWVINSVGGERSSAPVFSVPGGVYLTPQTVAITSAEPGATIYYTLDGSTPTTSSPTYIGPIEVSGPITIKAVAKAGSLPLSKVSSATYTFTTVKDLSDAKDMADLMAVGLSGVVVTSVFSSDVFYVEKPDRSSGIRVHMPYHGVLAGQVVEVTGVMATASSGERYVDASGVTVTGTGSVASLGMINKTLGGGPFGLQEGVAGGAGLNNIGLLVRTWGMITQIAGSTTDYTLADGSGVEVKIIVPPNGIYLPNTSPPQRAPDGTFVTVTGILTIERDGTSGDTKRVIRVLSVTQ